MKVVLQDGIKDCGICCLLSIIRYYGGDVPKEYLRELTNTTKMGVSAYQLIEGAKKLGMLASGVQGEIENLNTNNLPCIAHVVLKKSYQHFVVLYQVDFEKERVLLMDPSKGRKILKLSEFKLLSSNYYITLSPLKKLPIMNSKNKIRNLITNFLKKHKTILFFIIILTIFYFLFNMLCAYEFQYLLKYSISYQLDKNLFLICKMLLFIHLFKEINSYLRNLLLSKWSFLLDEEITMAAYKQIIKLPYLYYKNRTTGEVISRFKDLSEVKTFLSQLIVSISTDICSFFVFLFVIYKIHKKLFFVTFLMIIFLLLLEIFFYPRKKNRLRKYYKSEEKVNSNLIESMSSVEEIKGMHIEERMIFKFKKIYQTFLEVSYKLFALLELESFFKNSIIFIGTISLLGICSKLILQKEMALGSMVVFQNILNYLLSSLLHGISLFEKYPNYILSLNRIEDLFFISKEEFLGGNYYEQYHLKGDIVYHNFTYELFGNRLYDNLDLVIHYGEKVYLGGLSGSGKSTLMKLLLRYIEVPFSNISIRGIDINHYHLEVLRSHITYISQQEYLFTDTLYNNLTLFREVPLKKLDKICKLVELNEVIRKDPLGYQRIVEENGFNFSGGQRQRIILARSLLKESDIYIFDEALNQIDQKRERKILENIFTYLKSKTVIVISHREEIIDLFDRVIFLEKGKIVDFEKNKE